VRILYLSLCLSAIAVAQPAKPPTFEVASVRASQQGREAIEVNPGSVSMRNITLQSCVRWAYSVLDYQITAPGWMNETWFDIFAKSSSPAKESELREMMQGLLASRFQLVLHRQNKELSALVMTIGKNGHKLQPADSDGPPSFKTGKMSLTGTNATLAQLADFLSHELRYPFVDETGLQGRFNYSLDINAYVTEEVMKSAPPGGPPPDAPGIIAQAMKTQLGINVEGKKATVEMLIIDHAEKVPTDN
jgi:uncharacterized protein (TIGR03435 family)